MPTPRYTPDEIAHMGDAIYERDIRPRMTPDDTGRIVAVNVETGAYAIGCDELKAAYQVLDADPDAQIWLKRVGFDHVTRMPYMRLMETDIRRFPK